MPPGAPPAPSPDRPRTHSRLRGVVPGRVALDSGLPPRIGRYEIVGLIGRGAMGVVYKARDPLLDRVVAVKTISAPASAHDRVRRAFLDRFEREAKAAAGISHPAVVTIFDVGFDAESPFLVMEYLAGETLADLLDRDRMPLPAAVECARDLASALGVAHRLRIVHRDVKPANVLYAGDGRWKLADFGIARLPDSDLTQHGTFMGTPGYSPPEAIREGRYTVQADVFAWGALFYEMLCGHIPYEGPDTETTNKKVMAAEPPSPRSHEPNIPEPLARVAQRALAHDAAVRYADGTAVVEALTEAWQDAIANGSIPVTAFTMPVAVMAPNAPRISTIRDERPPLMTMAEVADPETPHEHAHANANANVNAHEHAPEKPPAVVREQTSVLRNDPVTTIRTSDRPRKPSSRRERLQRRKTRNLVLIVIVIAAVMALVWAFFPR